MQQFILLLDDQQIDCTISMAASTTTTSSVVNAIVMKLFYGNVDREKEMERHQTSSHYCDLLLALLLLRQFQNFWFLPMLPACLLTYIEKR
jgi:hypothetical protein